MSDTHDQSTFSETPRVGTDNRTHIGRGAIVIVLALLAVCTTNWAVQIHLNQSLVSSAATINISGRQRMLSQRVLYHARLLRDTASVSDFAEAQAFLKQAAVELRENHAALVHGSSELGIRARYSPEAHRLMTEGPDNVHRELMRYTEAALFLSEKPFPLSPSDRDLTLIETLGPVSLLEKLDRIVLTFQRETERRLATGNMLIILFALLTVVALAAIWLMLVRPLQQRVSGLLNNSQELSEHLSFILDATRDAILIFDTNQRITHFNRAAEQLFGYARDEMVGCGPGQLMPARSAKRHRALMDTFVASEEASRTMGDWREIHGRRKNGTEFPLLAQIAKVSILGRSYLVFQGRDMSLARRNEENLQRALDDAVSSSTAKTMFLSTLGHELRSPLNAIVGYADFLLTDTGVDIPPDTRKQYQRNILESGRYMLSFIDNILNSAKLDHGTYSIQTTSCTVDGEIRAVGRILMRDAQNKDITFNVDQSVKHLPRIVADPTALRQVFVNFVGNAIHYTPAGGRVSIYGTHNEQSETVTLSVVDTGPGMSQQDIQHVREPFYRGEIGQRDGNNGAGLGIFIAERIIDLHGGTLNITSAVGSGTTVKITLPINGPGETPATTDPSFGPSAEGPYPHAGN